MGGKCNRDELTFGMLLQAAKQSSVQEDEDGGDYVDGDGDDVVHNCTIFLCSLDVRNIDGQCRGPNVKEKDHLDG